MRFGEKCIGEGMYDEGVDHECCIHVVWVRSRVIKRRFFLFNIKIANVYPNEKKKRRKRREKTRKGGERVEKNVRTYQ